jgi:hypothetical protein
MRIFLAVLFAIFLGVVGLLDPITCYFTGDRVSGLHRLCYYDCLGSEYVKTIRNIDLCALSITVERP